MMQFKRLQKLEAAVLQDAGQFTTQPFAIPIQDETTQLEGYTLRPQSGFSGYFYDEQVKKNAIVLHFTAGHLKGDLLSLTSKERGHVSVPFVIGRNGKLFQLFSSAAWSYHLGRGAKGGNKAQSKRSIGIELSNFGPLTLVDGQLETIYSRLNGGRKHVYCQESDTDQYIKLEQPFRGYQYFASFTDAQYQTLTRLLRYLTAQYDIPRKFLPKNIRFKTTEKVVSFQGIVSHINYRETGKWDIGPAFDWDRVVAGVQGRPALETSTSVLHITPENAQLELRKAKDELARARERVKEIEAQISSFKTGATRSRGGGSARPATMILNTEEAVNKALAGSTRRGGRGRATTSAPTELPLEVLRDFYLD